MKGKAKPKTKKKDPQVSEDKAAQNLENQVNKVPAQEETGLEELQNFNKMNKMLGCGS